MATEYEILDGPSKWDLMLGLFDSSNHKPRKVEFTTRKRIYDAENKIVLAGHNLSVSVILLSVEKEDGSGESWNIKGYWQDGSGSEIVRIYFRTDHRTGTLTRD